MKNYKQILEAINRGILLALDDFEDSLLNEPISPRKDAIRNNNLAKELLDVNNMLVDLGLPSGTMWCKYNLGVNDNPRKLKIAKNWYGNYYSWAETKGKTNHDYDNYKYYNKDHLIKGELLKYCNNSILGIVDNKTILLPEDDAAYKVNKYLNIPSVKQYEELVEYTTHTFKYNYNGVKELTGIIFTSKINGNEIFFPCTGYYDGTNIQWQSVINLWTNQLNTGDSKKAIYFSTSTGGSEIEDNAYRWTGMTIRAVAKK